LVHFRNTLRKVENLPLGGGTALRSFLHLDLLRGRLGLFMTSYLLVYLFQYLCIPLFPLVYVDTLKLTDGMISLGSGLFYASMFLVSLRLNWLARRFSHHQLLTATSIGLMAYPLLIGLARAPAMYLIGSLVGGINYAILSASQINRLMEVVPEQERAAGMAFHNLALNLGILVGSLAGPVMGEWIGYQEGLILGAGLRFLAGLLMIFWG
jgi:predicted MFS family arabinose efflux permease